MSLSTKLAANFTKNVRKRGDDYYCKGRVMIHEGSQSESDVYPGAAGDVRHGSVKLRFCGGRGSYGRCVSAPLPCYGLIASRGVFKPKSERRPSATVPSDRDLPLRLAASPGARRRKPQSSGCHAH